MIGGPVRSHNILSVEVSGALPIGTKAHQFVIFMWMFCYFMNAHVHESTWKHLSMKYSRFHSYNTNLVHDESNAIL